MSVRVQRDENLIKKWASPVSIRGRHFDSFENRRTHPLQACFGG